MGKNEQGNPELPDFKSHGNLKGLGHKGVRLSKTERRIFFSRNNLLKNVGLLKDSFVKERKGKFYLGEKEPVKVAGINIPGFKILELWVSLFIFSQSLAWPIIHFLHHACYSRILLNPG